jgi:hypothetical protein
MTEPVEPSTVDFFGETFTLNPDVSEFALLEFAEAAADGQDGDTMQGLASMMRLVKECISDDDRSRFLVSCRKNRAGAAALTEVISAAFTSKTERPTGRPSDSSDGPKVIEQKSEAKPVVNISRFAGRPDIQLGLQREAEAARTA